MQELTIMIVEDEGMTALFLERMLMRRGYNVLKCVSTGEEALDCMGMLKPALFIMDIRLAGEMDGIETVKKIKADSSVPVQFIFSTGYTDQGLKDEAMKLNPLGFLVKPINMPELFNLIDSVL